MTFEMNLHPEPFVAIKSGEKDIEMRLDDERRKDIKVGDTIIFTNNQTLEKISVEVINLFRFHSFDELYKHFDKTRLGYNANEVADPKDMEKYYPKEKILRYGALAIEIKLK